MGVILRLRVATALILPVATGLIVAASAPASPLYVSDGSSGGMIWQFSQGAAGALSPTSPASVEDPGRIAPDVLISPDGQSAYALENGATGTGVYEFDVGADETLSPKSTASIPYGTTIGTPSGNQAAISPDGTSLYVSDFGGRIWEFTIGAAGLLSAKTPANLPTPSVGTGQLAVSPDGHSLYAIQAQAGGGSILQYDIGSGGQLSAKSPASVALKGASRLVISPDGLSLFATAENSVFQFDIASSGALSPKIPASVGPPSANSSDGAFSALAISPDGQKLYVGAQTNPNGCNDGPSEILHYGVGAGGQLTALDSAPGAPTNSAEHDLAVSSDGGSVYAAESCLVGETSGIAQYDVGAGGALTAKSVPFLSTGPNAAAIAITPTTTPTTTGGSGSSNPPPAESAPGPSPPKRKPLKCKKGFRKKVMHGKAKCVKRKPHKRKRHKPKH